MKMVLKLLVAAFGVTRSHVPEKQINREERDVILKEDQNSEYLYVSLSDK